MRVLVLGKGMMLANIVLGALDSGAEVVGVFRYENTDTPKWKLLLHDFFCPAPEVTLLKKLKIRQIRLKSANDELFRKIMLILNVDLMIVGTWNELITPQTYELPKIATVNVHPSLLPQYRGPNPYMQTILHGEKYSGLTIHLMGEKFDDGPILKQKKIKILENDTSKELRDRTIREVRPMVRDLISDLNEKAITPVIQKENLATYFPNIAGDENMLDFSVQSSKDVSRTVRALHPFLPCYISFEDNFLIVNPYNFKILSKINAKPGDIIYKNSKTHSLTIVCADKTPIQFNDLKLYKSRAVERFIEKIETIQL